MPKMLPALTRLQNFWPRISHLLCGMLAVWLKVGGGSDGNYTAAAGSATVDGLGPIGGRFHTDAEYLELDSIEPSLHVLEKILLDLQAKLYK